MTIKPSVQVAEFLHSLAPEPRRRLRLAIRSLAQGRGDIKALEGDLDGYWRLRVGSYRVILWQSTTVVECVFAERRSIVYEIFAEELRRKLADK
jgi:mRNA interferase RelE/StbE